MFLVDFRISEVRQAWRAGIVCAAALFISTSVFKMDSPHWVVLSALVCLQANFGASLKKAKERLVGTFLACIVGLAVIYFFPESKILLVVLLLFGIVVSIYKATLSYTYSIFAITLAVVVMSSLLFQNGKQIVLLRIEDVTLGIALGATGSLLLWPDFARKKFSIDLHLLTQSKVLLFEYLIEWLEDKKTAQDFFDQKIVSAQSNQNARMRMVEMSYEFVSYALPKKSYENFVLTQERIHYIFLTIFNIINDYNLKKNESFTFFLKKELESLKQLYMHSVYLIGFSQGKVIDPEIKSQIVSSLEDYIQRIISYNDANHLSLHESILISNLEWLACEMKNLNLGIPFFSK